MTEFDHLYTDVDGEEYEARVRHIAAQGEEAGFSPAVVADAEARIASWPVPAPAPIHSYKMTVRAGDGAVLESCHRVVRDGPGLWLAVARLNDYLRLTDAGHVPEAVSVTIERTCSCGEWPVSEYGDRCPSCPPLVRVPRPENGGYAAALGHHRDCMGDFAHDGGCPVAPA